MSKRWASLVPQWLCVCRGELFHVVCLTLRGKVEGSSLWNLLQSPRPPAIGFEGLVMGRARGIDECLEPTGSPDVCREPILRPNQKGVRLG